ncbi:MAG: hypothetical protein PVI83_05435 [Lysobacterales bacterium]
MGVNDSDSIDRAAGWFRLIVLCILLAPWSSGLSAFEAGPASLPTNRNLAAALSDPDSRVDTLLTLAAVQNLLDYGRYARRHEASAYAERFRQERAWLERLAARYGTVPVRSSLFDAAAWRLLLELDQHDLSAGQAVSPFGPRTDSLLRRLFDRSSETAAATVLPEVLSRMETASMSTWKHVLEAAERNVAMADILKQLNDEWFEIWHAAEPPPPENFAPGEGGDEASILRLSDEFRGLSAMILNAGPPAAMDLKRLRFGLLRALPELGWRASADAAYLLSLADAVEGLYEGRYLAFNESVLWVAASLLASEIPKLVQAEPLSGASLPRPPRIVLETLPGEAEPVPAAEPYRSPLPELLSEWLPAVSSGLGERFDAVDPRLNTGLASAFDVVQYLRSGEGDPDRLASLRFGIADAVAQFVLLVPDMDFYFSQPVRRDISAEVNICISRAASRGEEGGLALGRDEFDRCFRNLAGLAFSAVATSELSGDPDGPFGAEQLQRELLLPPWQRINYVLGYLLEEFTPECGAPDEELANPLEWSGLVTVLTWFARQSPVYFDASEYGELVDTLRQQGRSLITELGRQVECIARAGGGVNPPATRALSAYGESLNSLVSDIREAQLEFRSEHLRPGSDIMLSEGAEQPTSWRKENVLIGPCDARYICQMESKLEVAPELVALFPDRYRVAEQAGMGEMEICYDNVQWVSRRSEPVRENDPHVANYFGRFSFDLFGRFVEEDGFSNVFGFNFISDDEYHYLFGPADESVLNDRCPADRVGQRIVTPIGKKKAIRVVPDRLTYHTAARTLPSDLMERNWDRNQNWQAHFVAGQGVRRFELEPDPGFSERLDSYLAGLYSEQETALYDEMLTPTGRNWRGMTDSLHGKLNRLTTLKALLRACVNLFHPLFLIDSDAIRGLLEGSGALLDESMVRRARRDGVPVRTLVAEGTARVQEMDIAWERRPEAVLRTGSVSTSLVHAVVRLEALYRDFFAPRAAVPPRAVSEDQLIPLDGLDG